MAAFRRLTVLGAVAVASGVAFVVTAAWSAFLWAVPATLLGASVMGLVLSAGTKSLRGEFLVAAAFASVHGPVAASGAAGANGDHGAGPAFDFILLPILVWAASFALAMAAVAAQHPLAATAIALAPKALLVLAVTALNVHPRHLKRVGWSLVGADTATLVVLVRAF